MEQFVTRQSPKSDIYAILDFAMTAATAPAVHLVAQR